MLNRLPGQTPVGDRLDRDEELGLAEHLLIRSVGCKSTLVVFLWLMLKIMEITINIIVVVFITIIFFVIIITPEAAVGSIVGTSKMSWRFPGPCK